MAAIKPRSHSNTNNYWKSTYSKDYHNSGAKTDRTEPYIPRFRDIEPVLMARPFILKSQTPAGKPSGRFDDPNWTSMYRQSYKSHHMNRYEVDRKPNTTREQIQRPVFLPPIQPYMASSLGSTPIQPWYYATNYATNIGSQSDRPFYYATSYNPNGYATQRAESPSKRHWKSTYRDSYNSADEIDSSGFQPLLYYQPLRYNVPYFQTTQPPQNTETGGIDFQGKREYLSNVEKVQDPPPPPPPKYMPPVAQPPPPPIVESAAKSKVKNTIFHDESFDPRNKSYLLIEKFNGGEIKWLRPKELSNTPMLFSRNYITSDFKQGFLKDSWFLMACAAISRYPNLLKIVLPPDQTLMGAAHTGKVVVNFYLFGSWKTVAIDDRLPCYGDDLAYARCDNPDEFWVSMIEKAYAKVFGSYEALELGSMRDALTDLTGGICEFYNLGEILRDRVDLEHSLYLGSKCQAMMTCSRNTLDSYNEQEYRTGLISGHGYEITGVFLVPWERGGEEMVLRIQSPWDYTKPWTGSWSDLDPRWRTFTQEFKEFVGFTSKPVGEFFISYQDFLKQFHHVSICHLETTLYPGQSRTNVGYFSSHHGEWTTGINAGGSQNYTSSYFKNPQFHVILEPSKVPDDLYHDDKVLFLVSLMVPDVRGRNRSLPYFGFSIYEVNSEKSFLPLTREYLSANLPIASSGKFQAVKEIVCRFRVDAGEFVIIPSTYYPEKDSAYLLRTYSITKMTVQSFSAS